MMRSRRAFHSDATWTDNEDCKLESAGDRGGETPAGPRERSRWGYLRYKSIT